MNLQTARVNVIMSKETAEMVQISFVLTYSFMHDTLLNSVCRWFGFISSYVLMPRCHFVLLFYFSSFLSCYFCLFGQVGCVNAVYDRINQRSSSLILFLEKLNTLLTFLCFPQKTHSSRRNVSETACSIVIKFRPIKCFDHLLQHLQILH